MGTAAFILYPSCFSAEVTLTVTWKTLTIFLTVLFPLPFLESIQVSALKRHPFFEDSSSGFIKERRLDNFSYVYSWIDTSQPKSYWSQPLECARTKESLGIQQGIPRLHSYGHGESRVSEIRGRESLVSVPCQGWGLVSLFFLSGHSQLLWFAIKFTVHSPQDTGRW